MTVMTIIIIYYILPIQILKASVVLTRSDHFYLYNYIRSFINIILDQENFTISGQI